MEGIIIMILNETKMVKVFANRHKSILVTIMMGLSLGCQTLPKDAPQAYQDTKKALDQASAKKVSRHFPNSLKQAKISYDRAIDLYELSRETTYTSQQRTNAMLEAEKQLSNAKKLAEVSMSLSEQMQRLDNFQPQQDQGIRAEKQIIAFTKQLNAIKELKSTQKKLVEVSDASMTFAAEEFQIRGPVAFFGFAQSHLVKNFQEPIDALASFAEDNPTAKIHLIGYADPRGSRSLNFQLALDRAKSVAKALINRGIEADRIKMSSQGAVDDADKLEGKGHYQLNRRVEAIISA